MKQGYKRVDTIHKPEQCDDEINKLMVGWGITKEQNESIFHKCVGLRIRKRRLSLEMTQTEFAKLMKVTFQQVQKYEKGSNACPKYNEMKLCEFLDCDSDYFTKPITENNYKFLQKRERNGYADSNGTRL